jgi:hypothetical protein
MTDLILEEFERRQEDIDLMIDFITSISEGSYIKVYNEDNDELKNIQCKMDLVSTLNSLLHLMTYNQAESSIRGCIESLYDDFTDSSIRYSQLKPLIQKELLTGIYRKFENAKTLHDAVGSSIDEKIPSISLDVDKILSGNVERKTIAKIAENYNIIINAPAGSRDGTELGNFKNARNDLAHGNISFSKFGATKPLEATIAESNRVTSFLRSVIISFGDYISNKDYKN